MIVCTYYVNKLCIFGSTFSSAIIYLSSFQSVCWLFVKTVSKMSGKILERYFANTSSVRGCQPTIIVWKNIFLEEQLGNRISMYDRMHFKAYYLVHFWPHFWVFFENHKIMRQWRAQKIINQKLAVRTTRNKEEITRNYSEMIKCHAENLLGMRKLLKHKKISVRDRRPIFTKYDVRSCEKHKWVR